MYDFWINGERFYTMILPILVVIVLITLTAMIFLFYYTIKGSKVRKNGLFTVVFLMVGMTGYAYWQHTEYEPWIEQSSILNPGIRDRYMIMGTAVMEDPELVKTYRSMNQLDHYKKLEMYEETEVTKSFNNQYLGSTGNSHYFAIGDDGEYAFRYTGEVVYTDDPTQLAGAAFQLTDARLEESGFNAESPNYLETFYINQEEAEQATGEIPATIIHPSQVFPEWNLGYQSVNGTSLEH